MKSIRWFYSSIGFLSIGLVYCSTGKLLVCVAAPAHSLSPRAPRSCPYSRVVHRTTEWVCNPRAICSDAIRLPPTPHEQDQVRHCLQVL